MSVVINLRGTSGSGKSTVVRRVLDRFEKRYPRFEAGRSQPIAYVFTRRGEQQKLFIPGHYETACGGCDTITKPDRVYELVREGTALGADVMYEGIIVQDDTRRLLELNAETKVHVIELSTPLGECLAGIQARRDARGDKRELNPKNTTQRQVSVHRNCEKLRALGWNVPYLDRQQAYEACTLLLQLEGE